MISAQQKAALIAADCDVAYDNLTRQLYATDASIYQITPSAVAFPRDARQASSVIRQAAEAGIPIIPRGAGTGLIGGVLGEGLIIDFSRHNREISELNLEKRTVRVGAGVVLDQLNAFLKPYGFCFGPDVATSSRATLGGMIANNSSGSHVPYYGVTADHVVSLEIVMSDGRIEHTGSKYDSLRSQRQFIGKLIREHAAKIQEKFSPALLKRRPGYGLDRFLKEPGNLSHLFAGSEGTLGAILSAELKIVPLPKIRGIGLVFFSSVEEAMQATVELLDLKPAAIEHVDSVLFDQTKGQLAFKAARDLLELDEKPCEAILAVEFFEDNVTERLDLLVKKNLGLRTTILRNNQEIGLVWNMRKAGLSLVTGCKGDAKPVTCVEDGCVRPEHLPEYVAGLKAIMKPLGLHGSFYGHAASGLLHVRPVLNLHKAEDVVKMRKFSDEAAALIKQFKGSVAGEHGVGIARTEYVPEQLGPELMSLTKEIKAVFDPKNVFNPGKVIPDGRYKIDTNLRMGGGDGGYRLELPFEPTLAFAAKDNSFVGNLEQCNGCGGCRKDAPTMCPTFVATGEEIMSTRGRANTIRAVLEHRGADGGDPLSSEELETALANCLSCKACTTECPSNVNMALLKAELLYARHKRDGLPLRERILSDVDLLGKLGCAFPSLANAGLKWPWLRSLMQSALGIEAKRPLPPYAEERFDHWFAQHVNSRRPTRGKVILWDDTFVRYHEPNIGMAAVAVLEAAGFEVVLPNNRRCCGRPAFSQGNLDEAAKLGRHNLELLSQDRSNTPILFLEPSCYSMFAEDYRELKLASAEEVSKRCHLFEQFIENLLSREPNAIPFNTEQETIAIHAHCHAKSLVNPAFMTRLLQRLPNRKVTLLETGCCGMAGAFGAIESKYELSLKVAAPLVDKIGKQPSDSVIVASGTSCRHQIEHLTPVHPKHMAEVLAAALGE
ncbi:FAD-binding and (Fe-S)-binding domain-containing protein [Pedosphaera parvula]|uniref:FAD linked oxidase domain protein n=1 Tax=Pedosphaera parvula (strain Ellin514) TaxID=320771 RepID=B9XCW3_PEDPL|nr:FAD-binding and (Fe-S)-binding domain-containing protein [Pedosphaera parvula]EEF62309.1 FAD linked oxidase domain protein [Pedosphaera parvula Ellin514]